MEIKQIFYTIIERRSFQLEFFFEVEGEIFHLQYTDKTWSPEAIYRHFLMSNTIIKNMITGEKHKPHKLAISGGPTAEIELRNKVGISDVKEALDQTSDELLQIMENTTSKRWGEKKKNFYGKEVSTEEQVLSLLLHDSEHLGEVKWIFKRLTGWGDNEMYKIKN